MTITKIITKIQNYIFHMFVNKIAGLHFMPKKTRFLIYRLFDLNVGSASCESSIFFGGRDITIGKGSYINRECYFDNAATVQIGINCNVGMQVMFNTATHEIGNKKRRAGNNNNLSIIIGDGVWIGTRSVILPNVNIGNGCIIAAGAVVNKDCEENCLYGGVPAKKIKYLSTSE